MPSSQTAWLIADRYRLEHRAGSGGMGTVYRALDLATQTTVALKLLRAEAPGWQSRSRFAHEARALAEISHPAVVRYVQHGVSREHGPFLVMDWVEGETLDQRVRARGLTPREALRLGARLAGGLAALHLRSVVHRDLKPSNVMLRDGDVEQAVIVDLGVARLADASLRTQSGDQVGTPRYMAPEQIRNARGVDGRADVFALGCVLFECLTGCFAFDGVDPVGVLARILFEPLPRASALRPELPAELDALVLAMLERDPSGRPHADALRARFSDAETALARDGVAELAALARHAAKRDDATLLETPPPADEQEQESMRPSFEIPSEVVARVRGQGLPEPSSPLFGRERETAHLAELLGAGTQLVTIWGGAGLGKTRLAIESARRALEHAERRAWDCVAFADLSAANDVDDLARVLARETALSLGPSTALELALAQAMSKLGRVLLILDPVEHLIGPLSALLSALRRHAPGVQVLVTSRTRFCPDGAVALELGPLRPSQQAGELSPGARLLLARATKLAALDSADPRVREHAERLCRALEGIPLAIELYAARVHVFGLEGLLARVPGAREPGAHGTDIAESAMRSALLDSVKLLSPAEQSAFAQCAVFRGGFTAAAAEAVLSVQGAERDVLGLIQALRDHSLLHAFDGDPARELRLAMFAPARELAWERLSGSDGMDAALRRHAAYYSRLFASPERGASARLAEIEREAENLLAAAEFAFDEAETAHTSPEAGMRALLALEPAMLARGALGSFRGLLERANALAPLASHAPRDAVLSIRIRQLRARLEAPLGRTASARAELERCLDEAQRASEHTLEATLLLDLGVVHHLTRELGAAERCYQVALPLLRANDDVLSEARCLANLGALHHDRGELVAASRLYENAVALFEQGGEARHRANCMSNLAVLEQELGHVERAAALYDAAITLLEPLRDARLVAIALGNFAMLELELDRPAAARARLERALALLAGSSDRRSESLAHARLGVALALLGRPSEARAKLARAESLAASAGGELAPLVSLAESALELAPVVATDAPGTRASQPIIARARERIANAEHASAPPASDDLRSMLRIVKRLLGAARAAGSHE